MTTDHDDEARSMHRSTMEWEKIKAPFASLKKTSENTVPADLLWKKNTVSAEKTSWKVQIIREANKAKVS